MKYPKHLLAFFIFPLLPLFAQATHIVGGELNYNCLGNNQYEIILSVYRDCINGVPWFDNPASIGIFDNDNNLIDQLFIILDPVSNDTLDDTLLGDCLVAFDEVCVHTTTYKAIVELPFIEGGYQLAYQRCCRNYTISNVPDSVGATYYTRITEKALLECNSNAKFKQWPPVYICVGEPILYDHSAFDPDGDSIVYKMCTPFDGASAFFPMPQPPNPPPYPGVPWVPPYDENNMLGGVPLQIDQETGLLTGTPNTVGQFVVGVCAEEYRDGELISVTRRDFQYNVGLCGSTTSAFFAPDFQCGDFTVSFDNQSINADEFIWFFNDPLNPNAMSTIINPVYTYGDTGTYTVMLIAEPDNSCRDTSFETITLFFDSLEPDFEYEFGACSDSAVVIVSDLSKDTVSTIVDWLWELDLGGGPITSTDQNLEFVLYNSQTVTLSLTVTAENGCEETISQTFPIELLEDELFADSIQICPGQSVLLNPDFLSNATYQWSPVEGLDDTNSPNPVASPEMTTTYSVTITDNTITDCQIVRQITVVVPIPVLALAPEDTVTCEPFVLLTAETNTGVDFIWATDPLFNGVIGMESTVSVSPFGAQTYYLRVLDVFGCKAEDTVTVVGNGVNVASDSLHTICEGDTIQLSVTNLDPDDILTYNWTPPDDIISGANTANPVVLPTEPGIQSYFVELENQHGCTLTDTVPVGVIDTTDQAGFVSFQQCGGYSIHFENTSPNAPFYIWNFGDPVNPGAGSTEPNPVYTYPGPGNYEVTLTLGPNLDCPDTILKSIEVFESLIEMDFTWNFGSCSDSIEISFTDLSTNNQSDFISWNWQFGDGQSSNIQNPVIWVNESQILEVFLEVTSSDGCVDSLIQNIPIELIEVSLPDTVLVCQNEPTPLNPGGDDQYEYMWSPATGLNDPTWPNPVATISNTTTYSVSISNFSGDTCEIVRQVTAFVPPPIELMTTGDTVVCETEATLFAQSDEATAYFWSESPDFSDIIGMDAGVVVQPGRPSLYYVRVEDAFGCSVEDVLEVGNYVPGISVSDDSLCIGDTLRLFADNLFAEDVLTFQWSPESAILEGANSDNPLVNPSVTTTFLVEASNQFGCQITDTVEVFVANYQPPLDVNPVIDTIFEDDTIQITSTIDPNYIYHWTPSNSLNFNNISNPLASPTETTVYTLTIRDTTSGCVNSREVTVFVFARECAPPQIFTPSGFTPNGDGKNDFFEVFGNNIEEMFLAVYNRWGQKIFEAHSQDEKWDGTFKGAKLPPDVYGYYLRVRCVGGEEYFEKGNVTLLR